MNADYIRRDRLNLDHVGIGNQPDLPVLRERHHGATRPANGELDWRKAASLYECNKGLFMLCRAISPEYDPQDGKNHN